MAYEFVIQGVTETLIGGELRHPAWRVDYIKPDIGIENHWFDGGIHNQHIPKAAMEWRMAEYDFPTVEEAMDLLIHEPWMASVINLPETESDMMRAAPSIMRTVEVDGILEEEPITLYNAERREDATKAIRTRLSVVKKRIQVVSANVTRKTVSGALVKDPLDVMRTTHRVTRAGVEEKRSFVIAMRQERGLDSGISRMIVPTRYAAVNEPNLKDDGAARRILEQKADPKDHMWD